MSSSEGEIVGAAVRGDAAALSRLLEQFGPEIERGLDINPLLRTVIEPADVMQVTYLEAFLQIHQFDPERGSSFAGWLRRIAENNLRDAIRALERQKQPPPRQRIRPANREESLAGLFDLLDADSATPSRRLRHAEACEELNRAVEALPDRYREVVQLYDLEGRSIEELAQRTGRSPGALYMLRARAHDRLRAQLDVTTGTD